MDLKIEKEDLITSTDFMETIRLIGIGIIFGIANVIPGVSGGTIAVVFNVYDRLINVITLNLKKIVKEWNFLVPLALGAVVGVILFSKLISLLFTKFPVQTNWFFIGIILGSIPMIYSRIIAPAEIISDDESETIQDKKKIPDVGSTLLSRENRSENYTLCWEFRNSCLEMALTLSCKLTFVCICIRHPFSVKSE